MRNMAILLCSAVIVAVSSAVSFADFNTIGNGLTGIRDLQYSLNHSGDSSSGDTVSFRVSQDDQASLQTCATNSMSPDPVVMDLLPLAEYSMDYPIVTTSFATPTSSSDPPTPPERRYPPDRDDPPPPVVPEPATMLIFGLGVCGLAPFARRYRSLEKPC